MLSEEFKNQLEETLEKKLSFIAYGNKKQEIKQVLENSKDLDFDMALGLFALMPISDILDYEIKEILDFASHGVFLRKNNFYNVDIPDNIFLGYVLNYRVNNEDIVRHRKFFYEKVKDLIVKGDMEKTIININYWCGKEVTYKSTDERTANPLTVYNSGYGRCGEESTFTVSVLRSVGIPARQVYVPLWAHCDDNHAWVEVWCNGQWKFLGACEPEETLNKGWFNRASTRAMMVHSKWLLPSNSSDVVGKKGISYVLNQTERYAKCKTIEIKVQNGENKPVKNAKILFYVLNYGGFGEIASLYTDDNGMAKFTTGYGSLLISAFKDNKYTEQIICTKDSNKVLLNIDKPLELNIWKNQEIIVPKSNEEIVPKYSENINFDEKERKDSVKKLYTEKINNINKLITKVNLGNENENNYINKVLKLSSYNYKEILEFLREEKFDLTTKIDVLKNLSLKDYRDIKKETLIELLEYTPKYKNDFPYEIYRDYVLNFRVDNEKLVSDRKFISKYLKENKIEPTIENVIKLINRINTVEDFEYDGLITSAKGAILGKVASEKSKKIIIVEILRTIGIPSRINTINGYLEAYINNGFVSLNENKSNDVSKVKLITNGKSYTYFQELTISLYNNGEFKPLNILDYGEKLCDKEVDLYYGRYKIILSTRLPKGNVILKYMIIDINSEKLDIYLEPNKISDKEMLQNNLLENISFMEDTKEVYLQNIIEKNNSLLVWIEEGMEPSEHILNELIERKDIFNNINLEICFIVRNKEALKNSTLKKAVELLNNVRILFDDFNTKAEYVARRMYQEPKVFPLIIMVNKNREAVYGVCGYNCGSADMILKLYECI